MESPRPWSSEEDGVLLRLFINLSEVVSQLPLDERWKRWKGMNWTLFAQDHAPSRSVDEVRARFYHYVEAGIGIRFGMPRSSIESAGQDDLFGFPSSSEATTHIEVNTDMPPAEQQGENGKDGRNQQEKGQDITDADAADDTLQAMNQRNINAVTGSGDDYVLVDIDVDVGGDDSKSPSSRPIRLFNTPEMPTRVVLQKKEVVPLPLRGALDSPSTSKPVNEYERQRLDHIQKNREKMKRLLERVDGKVEESLSPEPMSPSKKLKKHEKPPEHMPQQKVRSFRKVDMYLIQHNHTTPYNACYLLTSLPSYPFKNFG